jgi:DNA-binding Lrp family transcriptional regulator
MEKKSLDKASVRILKALQADGRRTLQDLANLVGLSSTPCWRRLKALEEEGIIERYTVVLDREKLGLDLCAFAHVSLQRASKNAVTEFEAAMRACPEVVECFVVTGDADYVIKVLAKDAKAYHAFLQERIFSLPSVAGIRSTIALHEVKSQGALPL